jgi:large subunit ribosomal protein L30
MDAAQKTIRIKWIRSGIGFHRSQSEVVRSLGLRRLNHVVERPDTPQVRGLIAKVAHLVEVVDDVPGPMWGSSQPYAIKVASEPVGASEPAPEPVAASEPAAAPEPAVVSEPAATPEGSPSGENEESEKHEE